MAFKTILKTGGEKRELLTFSVRYFEAKNKHFSVKPKKDSGDNLDELYLAAKSDPHAFRPAWGLPYGGLFELTMQSTADDDWLYEWMIPSKIFGTRFEKGVIEFYNDDDDHVPYKCIEFWDAWVADLSETMSSTGNMPMTLKMRISAATVRYNKLLVVQKNWFWTDINETESKTVEESELFVADIKWRGRKGNYISAVERKDMMLNHNITLEVEVRDYAEGESFELTVRQSKGRRIKGNSTEFTIQGTVNDSNIVLIENFKVECDFKDDNQDFGYIEFYHNDRKVAEFKENFGWTYIKEGGITKVFVNVELEVKHLPIGCLESDLKEAINACFKRTLSNSSDGMITGKLFFSGIGLKELPQFIPSLTIVGEDSKAGGGHCILGYVTVFSSTIDTPDYLMDLAEVTVHEFLHTTRLDHPFERVQSKDSELVRIEGRGDLMTGKETDKTIFYNIMNYNSVTINNYKLGKLWREKRPEYLTKGQLQLMFNEIDMQKKGAGVEDGVRHDDYDYRGNNFGISTVDAYWTRDIPGIDLYPESEYMRVGKKTYIEE